MPYPYVSNYRERKETLKLVAVTLNCCSVTNDAIKNSECLRSAVNCLFRDDTQTVRGVSVAGAKPNNDSLEAAQEQMALQAPISAL